MWGHWTRRCAIALGVAVPQRHFPTGRKLVVGHQTWHGGGTALGVAVTILAKSPNMTLFGKNMAVHRRYHGGGLPRSSPKPQPQVKSGGAIVVLVAMHTATSSDHPTGCFSI